MKETNLQNQEPHSGAHGDYPIGFVRCVYLVRSRLHESSSRSTWSGDELRRLIVLSVRVPNTLVSPKIDTYE